jgi:predicted ATP-dependent endonuclease of OLD family
MIIEIKNFGPIDYLKFDLHKDLHLIYGENAIGKSYATYCLYCLIKNLKNKRLRPSYLYFYPQSNKWDKFIRPKLKLAHNKKEIHLGRGFEGLVTKELKEIFLDAIQNSLRNTFSSLKNLKNRYTNKNYEIIVTTGNQHRIVISSNSNGEIDLTYDLGKTKYFIVQKSTKTSKYSLYRNDKMVFGKSNVEDFAREFSKYCVSLLNNILNSLDFDIRDIYYLPASRSGLYQALNALTPIIAELTQVRFFIQNKSIELPALSEPLSDYFIDLSTLDKKHTNREFNDIVKALQTDILKGEVDYNEKTKTIVYRPKEIGLELSLSEASSMVAEMSPLVLYFKHILNYKFSSTRGTKDPLFYDPYYAHSSRRSKYRGFDILFIEEPEAHLHPEVQVKLIEIFAKLTSKRLKVFITSHSNYMFNKLNNLIITGGINAHKIDVYHLIREQNGTIQNSNMKVTEEGINDENFQDVSERLYIERLNSLQNKNVKANIKK